jgi:hypothetical protein
MQNTLNFFKKKKKIIDILGIQSLEEAYLQLARDQYHDTTCIKKAQED